MSIRILLSCLLLLGGAEAVIAVEPFLAPALPQGSIEVRLHATEAVMPSVPTVASFGVPFPHGSVSNAALANLRVLDGAVEIPAYVIQLTPWRHRSDVGIDGQSVRVALVQVEVSFSTLNTVRSLTVEWGGTPRTLSRPLRALRATTWHQVTSGSFIASDNVFEPNVLAELPAQWLSNGALRGSRALTFDPGNPATRDSPAANDAILTWPGYQEQERAHKNDFYNVINEDDPLVSVANQCPYKTGFEPWLYDRASVMFALHFRSGFVKPLREALRNTDFYRGRINASGQFALDPTDNKYSFNESLAYAYWMTGDETFLPAITSTANYHNGDPHAWTAGLGFWTERMVGFKLMTHLIDYEITGNAARRDSVDAIIAALLVHQNGGNGVIPSAGRIDGGFYHTGNQHGDWDSTAYGASTWMTALLTEALRRAYASKGDSDSAQMIRRSGTFLKTALRTEAGAFGTVLAPRYVIEFDGTDFAVEDPLHDEEHALDVAAAIAWADYFGALLNQRDATLAASIAGLYATYDLGVNYWIRPAGPASGLPAFRVSPWRKWAWQHRGADGMSFAIAGANAAGETPLFGNGFESP